MKQSFFLVGLVTMSMLAPAARASWSCSAYCLVANTSTYATWKVSRDQMAADGDTGSKALANLRSLCEEAAKQYVMQENEYAVVSSSPSSEVGIGIVSSCAGN